MKSSMLPFVRQQQRRDAFRSQLVPHLLVDCPAEFLVSLRELKEDIAQFILARFRIVVDQFLEKISRAQLR
jgi:hypothetical protein